jgi:chemotaxis response regulator CheB
MVANGGIVLVQDRGTSAVWGMPGAAAAEALASGMWAPKQIEHEIAAFTAECAP